MVSARFTPVTALLAAYRILRRESLLPTGEVDRASKDAGASAVALAA